MHPLTFLSLRYWRRRTGRGATTALGVALGVALLVSVGLVNDNILATYRVLTESLAGRAQLEVRALQSQGLEGSWRDRVEGVPGVAVAVPLLEERSFLFFEDHRVPMLVRGIDPEVDHRIRPLEVALGRPLLPEDERAILLAAPLAASLGVDVPGRVELLSPEGLFSFQVVGTFAGRDPLDAPLSRVAMVPLTTLQQLYRQGGGRVGQVDVVLNPDADLDAVHGRLAELTTGVAFVQRPQQKALEVARLTRGVRFMLLLASVMSLVAAAFLIGNNVLAVVSERRTDLATVRAIGLGRSALMRWLLLEVLVLAAVGGLVGVLLGTAAAGSLAEVVSRRLLDPYQIPLSLQHVPATVQLLGFGLGVVIALLAALPAVHWTAREGSLALHLRRRAVPAGARSGLALLVRRWSLSVGLLLSLMLATGIHASYRPTPLWSLLSLGMVLAFLLGVAAFLPVALGELGASLRNLTLSPLWLRLAADSLRQHRRRTGAVAASLMITLSILVGVFGMVRSYRHSVDTWVDGMFGWDLMVSTGAEGLRSAVPLTDGLEAELEDLAEVELASPERFALVAAGTKAVNLYAYDMTDSERIRRFATVDGLSGADLPEGLRGRDRVALSIALAPKLGLGVGDRLMLTTPEGPRPFEVVALVQDPGAASEAVYMDRDVYGLAWRDPVVDSFALLLAPGADPEAVAALIRGRFQERFPLQLVSAASFKTQVDRMVTETFGLSQGLVLVAVLVALFGLANAAMLAAWQLRHQLAVLRALGAPGRLLTRTLLAEAWLTSVLAGAVGMVMGTMLSTVLLRSLQLTSELVMTWSVPYGAYAWVLGIALVGSLVAGYLPSRAAGRPPVQEVLRTEHH